MSVESVGELLGALGDWLLVNVSCGFWWFNWLALLFGKDSFIQLLFQLLNIKFLSMLLKFVINVYNAMLYLSLWSGSCSCWW